MAETHNHKTISNTALPYNPSGSPIGADPEWSAGSNILTSWKGFSELRPGWEEIEDKTFDATPKRIFTWRRWSGDFYVMVSEGLNVWYKNMTSGGSFTLLWTSASTTPFDFIVSNNYLYFMNGTDAKAWDGTTLRNWGIPRRATKPTVATGGAAPASSGTFRYVTAYGSSITNHVSSRSEASDSITVTSAEVDITLVASADAQVDRIHVYRSTNGGDGVFYEITGSPFANANATESDATEDEDLGDESPTTTSNDPPPAGIALAWFANRIWIADDNKLWYTGWEEIRNGVEEESVPSGSQDGNFFAFDSEVKAVAAMEDGVIPYLSSKIHKIDGDTQDTFRRTTLSRLLGTVRPNLIAQHGKLTAWVDSSKSVWITDSYTQEEISVPIRADLESLSLTNASLSFHISGQIRWLVLVDYTGQQTLVYDLDRDMWMPPWTCYGTAIHSGEVSEGSYSLLMAANNRKIVALTPTAYVDPSGSTYTANGITNLFPILNDDRAGHVGYLEHVEYETNDVLPSSTQYVVDDDPTQATFTTMHTADDSPLRTQGTYIKSKRSYSLQATCRRVSVKFNWSASESPFKLYSFDLATRDIS